MNTLFKLILSLLLVLSIGCEAAVVIGPIINAALAWKDGEAFKYYQLDTVTLHNCLLRSLSRMGYSVISDEVIEGGFYIVAGDNDKFKITIKKTNDRVSSLSIRINFMGDKPYAELIYQEIDNEIPVIEFKKNKGRFLNRRKN